MKGLAIFHKTSSRRSFNLASWHSPHSLTWSWILSVRRHQVSAPKLFTLRTERGFGAGIGPLLSAYFYKTHNGWTWDVCLLWHGLHFTRQSPMWYRDMYDRLEAEKLSLWEENRKLRDVAYHLGDSCIPGNIDLLDMIADEIDCMPGCECGDTEWDTNAFNCSKMDEGTCGSTNAEQLRQLATAFRNRQALTPSPVPRAETP